ncbi:MAG: PAS domain S-box protein [Deltaproteobacteria bacterium]|nr:PAS domain S-box protein [Deltaproteobacteria bacterium]MBW2018099.1 PAS domain S-box protein [Deltaproteobacteria bacterium]MBW2304519.1 PAS domain S-box protein [Deltaproteobacteria bacterium]
MERDLELRELRRRVEELEARLAECIETKNAIEDTGERYRILFDKINDAVLVHQPRHPDRPGLFIEVNKEACRKYGYSKEEFSRLTVENIVYHGGDQPFRERIRRLFKEKHILFESVHRTKEGTCFPCEVNAHLFDFQGKPTILSIVRDITDRKRAEEALREERDRAQKYLDIAGVIFLVLDRNGTVSLVNRKGIEVLGYSEEEILGKNWFDTFIPEENREPLRGFFQGMIEGKLQPVEYHENPILTKDGNIKIIAWHNSILRDKEGNISGTLSSGEDITRQKQDEEEKRKLMLMLQHAQKMEAIGTLAGGIAHDFNNILTPLIVHAEMALLDLQPDHTVRNNLEQILNSAKRARDLVKQILTFSRQQEHEPRPLKVGLIIKEALKLLRASLPTTIEIRQRILSQQDTVLADPVQIHQVFMNLATNAAHAMREDGGVLTVTLEDLVVGPEEKARHPELTANCRYVKLTVADTGHGMERAVLERIFEPYFTTKVKGEGTGMGLAVVLGIVKSHKGVITVESEPGKGSTFEIYLPRCPERPPVECEEIVHIPRGNETILLVDDEPGMIETLQLMLLRLNYKVEARTGSLDALQAFRANPDKFDLVITDMTMPHMTGIELAREILGIRSNIPIILCTGFSELVSEETAKAAGIKEFIMKPIVMNEIALTIRRALNTGDGFGNP